DAIIGAGERLEVDDQQNLAREFRPAFLGLCRRMARRAKAGDGGERHGQHRSADSRNAHLRGWVGTKDSTVADQVRATPKRRHATFTWPDSSGTFNECAHSS